MANLNVSYQDMHDQAQALRTGREQIDSELNSLKVRINNLVSSGFVTDSASGAFNNSYESFSQGASQTISALDQLATQLSTMATTLQETDASLAAQMGS